MHLMRVPLQGKKKYDWVVLMSQSEVDLLYGAVKVSLEEGGFDEYKPLLQQLTKASTSHESTVEDSERAEASRSASDPLSDDGY